MTSDASRITINEKFLEAIQYALGTDLTCEELKAISYNADSSIKIVFGCIQTLNYGTNYSSEYNNPELQQVMLSDVRGKTKLINKTNAKNEGDCVAENLNDFERIFKNAADFGHGIFAIFNHDQLVSVTLRVFECSSGNRVDIAKSIDVPHIPFPRG